MLNSRYRGIKKVLKSLLEQFLDQAPDQDQNYGADDDVHNTGY
jgi:hypothetical protein